MFRKSSFLLVCLLTLFLVTGCNSNNSSSVEDNNTSTNASKNEITSTDDLSSKKGSLSCTREGSASEGITPAFNYYIEYDGENILELHSIEMVTSEDEESLDLYEDAYNDINENYKGLKYYDSEVIRTSNSVTRDTVINYDKIDVDALIDLEGEEDNIFEDGKAKLDIWLEFASQFGVTCEEA